MKTLIDTIRKTAAQYPHLIPQLQDTYDLAREEAEDTSEQNATNLALQEIQGLIAEQTTQP